MKFQIPSSKIKMGEGETLAACRSGEAPCHVSRVTCEALRKIRCFFARNRAGFGAEAAG